MRILFLGKRHSTHQDVLATPFGRMYWLPRVWHEAGLPVQSMLLDYYALRPTFVASNGFGMQSVPVLNPASLARLTARAPVSDVVVASGDCFAGLLGLRIARRLRAGFAFDVYDDYRTFGAYRAFMGWDAFGFLGRHADLVMYASRRMADKHVHSSPCAVVPNGVDETAFAPIAKAEARARIGLAGPGRLIGYFGSMTPEHGVDVLIRALHEVRASKPDVQLLLGGRRHPATVIDAEGVLYRGMIPHEEIPAHLSACDVLALPYQRGAFIDEASSCKIAEYLYSRRPIVATRTPNLTSNFPAQSLELDALLAPPGEPQALARSIHRQLDEPVVAQAPEDMSWRQIALRAARELERITGQTV